MCINTESCSECSNCNHSILPVVPKPLFSAFLVLTEACNLACRYCVPAGTKILMEDLTEKDIEDVVIGDRVVGFDEYSGVDTQRKTRSSTVEQVFSHKDDIIEIIFEDNTSLKITKNHPILLKRPTFRGDWEYAGYLKVGQSVKGFKNFDIYNTDIQNQEYKKGYFIAAWMGDGSYNQYFYNRYAQDIHTRIRFVVKDDEFFERVKNYSDDLGFDFYVKPSKISTYEGDIYKDALFSSKHETFQKLTDFINANIKSEDLDFLCGFLAGILDAEGHISDSGSIRITNSDPLILQTIEKGAKLLGFNTVKESCGNKHNKDIYNIRIISGKKGEMDNVRFIKTIKPAITRKTNKLIFDRATLLNKKIIEIKECGNEMVFNIGTTTRTYFANSTAVHNCFVHQNPRQMTYRIALDTANMLIRNTEAWNSTHEDNDQQIPIITFFGGEPTLRWDDIIVPLINHIRNTYNKPFSFSMTSNTVLLNKERLTFLSNNKVDILFSIDGAKETQDYNRPTHNGKGSFDLIKDNIPLIAEMFPNTTFRSTIVPATVHLMYENFIFAMNSGYTNFFHMPNHFEIWDESAKTILKEQLCLISNYFIDCYRTLDKQPGHSPLEQKLDEIKRINNVIDSNTPKSKVKCGFGLQGFAAVAPDGKIIACQEMTSHPDDIFIIGDIYNGIDNKRAEALYRLFDDTKKTGTNCDSCKASPICNGGCMANNYIQYKDVNHLAPIYCYWEQILLDEAIRIMTTLGEEKNERFRDRYFK